MSPLVWGFAAVVLFYLFNTYRSFQKNLAKAKASGLPYFITPWYFLNRIWLVQSRLWLPLMRKLPKSLSYPWVDLLDNEWAWKLKREPFEYLGCNAFLIVSPSKLALFVSDADAISQIATRRNDFPKPIHIYSSVDIFGKNVVSTEGSIWRHHRKITSPPFTEKNNHMVWVESLHQAQSMMSAWMKPGMVDSGPVINVAAATMRLSLHVISKAGFGVRLFWPHEVEHEGKEGEIPPGHTMSYKDALSTLLENIIQAFLLPRWFLKYSPLKANKVAYEALTNWKQYMQEMYDSKKASFSRGESSEGMDLMGALVKGAGIAPTTSDAEKGKPSTSSGQLLTDSEILGNAFVFILAGHETAANTLHFSMLFLALHPASQRRLQADLDAIFGSRPVSEWSYDEDMPRLFGSMAGAVMNEELRVIPPVVGIPKQTLSDSPQPLTVDGRRVTVPSDCMITLDTVGAHLDRRHWPALVPPGSSHQAVDADLKAFKPERWLLSGNKHVSIDGKAVPVSKAEEQAVERGDDIGGPQSSDTSAALYKPPRGAYVPFSEGYRACLGRRFAQVEVLAVLAVIFREYSVELAVEEILSEQYPFNNKEGVEEVKDGKRAGREEWEQARGKVHHLFETAMMTIITIQMREGRVPIRFVKRGSERFDYDA